MSHFNNISKRQSHIRVIFHHFKLNNKYFHYFINESSTSEDVDHAAHACHCIVRSQCLLCES